MAAFPLEARPSLVKWLADRLRPMDRTRLTFALLVGEASQRGLLQLLRKLPRSQDMKFQVRGRSEGADSRT